ncbi:GGDEF domain-containing protein [Alginatibacterium sediminis]|uniref:diguanylate cyclase n=1 Tax=Alginatibacterium sediminis TaxID=2164068 RepID=A0A420E7Q5_9ALTE|nr:diguanylate cyclase [Alginatibacterium sediminis]RKF14552.1 GGDEF domain-containing protein [Alginatibacterium sediminis]
MLKSIVRVKHISVLIFILLFQLVTANLAFALPALKIDNTTNNQRLEGHFKIWHDPAGGALLSDARQAAADDRFKTLESKGSTGSKSGAIWSRFQLHNTGDSPQRLFLEYVDHQLVFLDGYQRNYGNSEFKLVAHQSMLEPFSERLISHPRFVSFVEIGAGETHEFYFRFASDPKGFVYPDLRLWQPDKFRYVQSIEQLGIALLVGGLLLIAIIALVGGFAIKDRIYFAYFFYALAKVIVWPTVLGYTHMYVLRDSFHWSYMSLSGGITIFAGLVFAREFLDTAKKTPRLDKLLWLMIFNSLLLIGAALMRDSAMATGLMTLALLLYPIISVIALRRWAQGSTNGMVYSLAWLILVSGLFAQGLRDLGFVEHNFVSYYWPIVASYLEMIAISLAMGVHLYRLRQSKELAEKSYRHRLETTKEELERVVLERTKELQLAKQTAELEARTDSLTGLRNRRSFFKDAQSMLSSCQRNRQSMAILMFDIDHFKTINDTHGHSSGDVALQTFAASISSEIRESDIFARIGGEEFVLAIRAEIAVAHQSAERLRKVTEHIYVNAGVVQFKFTTSIGIAMIEDDDTIEQVLNRADKALYQAKRLGRNRSMVA